MKNASIERLISTDAQVRTPFSGLPLLLKKLADDEVGFDELVLTLEQFPSVTARLLAVANSAWCAPRAPVTSLQSACTQLGLALIRSISISVAVSAPFDTRQCPLFDTVRFWYSSLLVAEGAELLAARAEGGAATEPRAVHTVGLLHNIGLLWLADKLPDYVTRACDMASRGDATSVDDALRQMIGLGVGGVGSLLLEAWGLPSLLATAIRHHRDPEYALDGWQSAALLGGAADMVRALRHGLDCPAALPGLDRLAVSARARQRVFERLREKSDRVQAAANALASL